MTHFPTEANQELADTVSNSEAKQDLFSAKSETQSVNEDPIEDTIELLFPEEDPSPIVAIRDCDMYADESSEASDVLSDDSIFPPWVYTINLPMNPPAQQETEDSSPSIESHASSSGFQISDTSSEPESETPPAVAESRTQSVNEDPIDEQPDPMEFLFPEEDPLFDQFVAVARPVPIYTGPVSFPSFQRWAYANYVDRELGWH